MTATEYHEASWDAYSRQAAPPDPADLSDHALNAFMLYEEPGLLLPSKAHVAVEVEAKRRGLTQILADELMAVAVLTMLGLGGVVIGWALLVP